MIMRGIKKDPEDALDELYLILYTKKSYSLQKNI